MNNRTALVNGHIYTVKGAACETVLIEDGIISFVGEMMKAPSMDGFDVVDLKGKTALPAFSDSHMHSLAYAESIDLVDLRGVRSIDDILKRTHSFMVGKKPEEWITGRGFDQREMCNARIPLKHDIDAFSDAHPVLLDRICGHIAVANSRALELIGITRDTFIPGGVIDKDENGEPNGILREAALGYARSMLPAPDMDDLRRLMLLASDRLLKAGIVSVHSDDLGVAREFKLLESAYRSLEDDGLLKIRVFSELLMNGMDALESFLENAFRTGMGSMFRIGPVKMLTDGSLGARTAALCNDYADDPGNRGVMVFSSDEIEAMVVKSHENGMQVALHAIGDQALESCVSAIEKAQGGGHGDYRHRIVHCQIASESLYRRMAAAGIMADIQPIFVSDDWGMIESRVGAEKAKTSYAWKSMLGAGIKLAGGSDAPVSPFNPLFGIYAAVTRKDLSGNPIGGWMPDECLSVQEAVELFTTGPAFASFEETRKGAIKEEYLGDIVVLSDDPFTIPPDEIKDIEVLMTISGGDVVFDNIRR